MPIFPQSEGERIESEESEDKRRKRGQQAKKTRKESEGDRKINAGRAD
jgi:hypothetical protein